MNTNIKMLFYFAVRNKKISSKGSRKWQIKWIGEIYANVF